MFVEEDGGQALRRRLLRLVRAELSAAVQVLLDALPLLFVLKLCIASAVSREPLPSV